MNINNKEKSIPVVIIGFLVLVGTYLYMHNRKMELLEKPILYSISSIEESYAIIGYFAYDYCFKYNNEEFKVTGTSNKKQKVGDRFIVKYSKENPENSELLLALPICDTILVAPQLGRKEFPKHLICKD
ncbi:hypothetical protein [uncultured Maribacter sp.]|uniref:hypothetical protein n=1 Tax=uncultured Maribacter sp. TaxID=431308 RepID=UPI00261E7BFC|nr:hypothetical protein [uncultured Maribacter sp.]